MSKIKVLMFGWEFPPFKSGGLGTACHDLTKGLAQEDVKVTFVMPHAPNGANAKFVKLIGTNALAKNVNIKTVDSPLTPYMNESTYEQHLSNGGKNNAIYGKNLILEVKRSTALAEHVARNEEHDIIHAHDWMTYQAAIKAKRASKKPLVVHLHATEFDRTGGHPDPRISHIEYEGLNAADVVITNSEFSKKNILTHYKIPANKIKVVHWGIDEENIPKGTYKAANENIVLFLGRVTIQKGPDYFIETAKKVLEYEPNTTFVIAGDGDMLPRIINRTSELGIANKVIFTGALRGDDVHKAFKTAKLYVMPSVSEPFGLVALESIKNGTPVLLSKTSGVSEVVQNALKADFWDIDSMTNKIVSVLRHNALREDLSSNAKQESAKFTLREPARKVKEIYETLRKH